MKEKPILFSALMVTAILEGRKTQTRRVVKPAFGKKHPIQNLREHGITLQDCSGDFNDPKSWGYPCAEDGNDIDLESWAHLLCPYGKPGDQLWVRETWYCDHYEVQSGPYKEVEDAKGLLVFRADNEMPYEEGPPKWKPAIHMPRWASRITLPLIGVRVERLQDISEDDALAEGIFERQEIVDTKCYGGHPSEISGVRYYGADEDGYETAVEAYENLWESINGAGSWDANPWVWVLEFQKYDN